MTEVERINEEHRACEDATGGSVGERRGERMTGAEEERVETAYHEAGHAVALYALGFDLGGATIVSGRDHLGRVGTPTNEAVAERLDVLEYLGEDGETYLMRQIVLAFSGVKSVEILTGQDHDPRAGDVQFWLPGSDWHRLNTWLPMLAAPEDYPSVYDKTWDEAERVLRENWGAVSAVAAALLERGELDAATLRSTLREADCARDDAPIRRVVLIIEGDLLRERRMQLMVEGDPGNELEGVQERIERNGRELQELYGEEDG